MRLENALLLPTMEIAVIIAASRLLGIGFRRLQQPQVIGEILAGILLGPSFLGWVAPELAATLFPPQALPSLKMLSEYGVLFFMFLVGLELDPTLLRGRGHAAVVISHVSIIAPFFLGALLAPLLYISAMFFLVRPLLSRFGSLYEHSGRLSQNLVAVVFVLVLSSAVVTELIGIHAIFGAFMLGAMLPKRGGFVRELTEKVEDFAVVFLLPIYFAYTGLRTQMGLLDSADLWLFCLLII